MFRIHVCVHIYGVHFIKYRESLDFTHITNVCSCATSAQEDTRVHITRVNTSQVHDLLTHFTSTRFVNILHEYTTLHSVLARYEQLASTVHWSVVHLLIVLWRMVLSPGHSLTRHPSVFNTHACQYCCSMVAEITQFVTSCEAFSWFDPFNSYATGSLDSLHGMKTVASGRTHMIHIRSLRSHVHLAMTVVKASSSGYCCSVQHVKSMVIVTNSLHEFSID